MNAYDERLEQLREIMAGKDQAIAALNDLLEQRIPLVEKAENLYDEYMNEQQDVDNLTGPNIETFLRRLFGELENARVKERAERDAAHLKFKAAKKEMNALDARIDEQQRLINEIESAKNEYGRLLREKAKATLEMGNASTEELDELRTELMKQLSWHEEISDGISAAISEGQRAKVYATGAVHSFAFSREAQERSREDGTRRVQKAEHPIAQMLDHIQMFCDTIQDSWLDERSKLYIRALFEISNSIYEAAFCGNQQELEYMEFVSLKQRASDKIEQICEVLRKKKEEAKLEIKALRDLIFLIIET